MTLRYENKEYILENPIPKIDELTATPEELAIYNQPTEYTTKLACIMVATMVPELKKFYKDYRLYEMSFDIVENFHKKARQEMYEVVKSLMMCKSKGGDSVYAHIQKTQR